MNGSLKYAPECEENGLLKHLKNLGKVDRLFAVMVMAPIVLSGIYYGFFASDVFISESRYVVRSPERQSSSALGLMLKGAGFSRAEDDSYVVQNYILSRDALQVLESDIAIRKRFSGGHIDLFSRFGGLDFDQSMENFYRFYQKKVDVQVESASSISTLSVRAYTAEDARLINEKLLERAEALVNNLNERGRQDLIRFAQQEVAGSEQKAKAAALALARYRNEKSVIDPEKQSTLPLQQVAKLQEELIITRAQIGEIEKLARDNPQLPLLRGRAVVLEREIQNETQRVAGSTDRSLASKAAEFQRLALEKEFADKMLASAMSTLEQARNEAQRKQLYLERIVLPNLPDEAMEPKRLKGFLSIVLLSLLAYGVVVVFVAGVREHQD